MLVRDAWGWDPLEQPEWTLSHASPLNVISKSQPTWYQNKLWNSRCENRMHIRSHDKTVSDIAAPDLVALQPGGVQFQSLQGSFSPNAHAAEAHFFLSRCLFHTQFKCREHHQIFPVCPSSDTAGQVQQLQLQLSGVSEAWSESSWINHSYCCSPWNLHTGCERLCWKMNHGSTLKRNSSACWQGSHLCRAAVSTLQLLFSFCNCKSCLGSLSTFSFHPQGSSYLPFSPLPHNYLSAFFHTHELPLCLSFRVPLSHHFHEVNENRTIFCCTAQVRRVQSLRVCFTLSSVAAATFPFLTLLLFFSLLPALTICASRLNRNGVCFLWKALSTNCFPVHTAEQCHQHFGTAAH